MYVDLSRQLYTVVDGVSVNAESLLHNPGMLTPSQDIQVISVEVAGTDEEIPHADNPRLAIRVPEDKNV